MLQAPVEAAFDQTVDYLTAKNLFIVTMDKQAGFIQARQFVKDKRVLSAKMGDRKTLNFILRPKGSETTVSLNIYVEEYSFGGDINSRNYYYEDKGILEDKIAYEDILNELQSGIKPQG